jgi:hypothetical protein
VGIFVGLVYLMRKEDKADGKLNKENNVQECDATEAK